MIVIKDSKNRKILHEGRNFGVGFGFLKQLSPKTFETVQPISACKDYLNDVVYSEHTGNKCVAHGLTYNKQDIFKDKAYLAISVLDYNGSGATPYAKLDWEKEALEKGIDNIKILLSFFEDVLGMKDKTTFVKVKENLFFAELPIEWTASTYMISLYSLLIRIGRWFSGENVLEYLKGFNKYDPDTYLVKNCLPSISKLIETKLFRQDLSKNSGGYSIHDKGIMKYINAEDLIK